MIKIAIGKILCFLDFHKTEIIEKGRGILGGKKCLRPGCLYRIEPIRKKSPKHSSLPP
jgi:hypothetical protein